MVKYNLEEIKDIPIQDVLENYYGIKCHRKGNSLWCAIRNEKTPSCRIYPDTNTWCDFGDGNRGGTVITLVQHLSQCEWKDAVRFLGDNYNIQGEYTQSDRRFPSAWEFKDIHIAFDRATLNFDFDIDKYGISKTRTFSEKYNMNVEELSIKYPEVYHNMLRAKAIPFVNELRNDYYLELYFEHQIRTELGDKVALENREYEKQTKMAKHLNKLHSILHRAITDPALLKFSYQKYDPVFDLKNIINGKIQIEIGDVPYVQLKKSALSKKEKLAYQKLDYLVFTEKKEDIPFEYAAFLDAKTNQVNVCCTSNLMPMLQQIYSKESSKDNPKQQTPVQEKKYDTIVINLLGGPGAGKTTCAWLIASELKKLGIVTEYVSEVAKEYVWDNNLSVLNGSLSSQRKLLEEQDKRVQRLIGKVEAIVTDSPILINPIYLKEENREYNAEIIQRFKQQKNINIFVKRGKSFEIEGRIHSHEESQKIDEKIINLLTSNNLYYESYYHDEIPLCIENIQKAIQRANKDRIDLNKSPKNFIKDYCIETAKISMSDLTIEMDR